MADKLKLVNQRAATLFELNKTLHEMIAKRDTEIVELREKIEALTKAQEEGN